jgi:hypothetical protein
MRKHAIKILGLSLMAALGLTAFMAVGAQATTTVPINVKGSSTLAAPLLGTVLLGRLLVPALKLEIHCEKGTVSGTVNPASLPAGQALVEVLYEECLKIFKYNTVTLALEEELSSCLIETTGLTAHHIKAVAKLLGLLHNGTVYAIAHGDLPEDVFTEIKFKNCAVTGATVKIKGLYAFEVEPNSGEQVKLLLKPGNAALQTLLGGALKFGANPAFIDEGVAHAELTGTHAGVVWGAI